MDSSPAPLEGDIAAGSGSIRLVRLRLTLALIAMAVLPVAVGAPLATTALDGQRAVDQLRTERDSSSVAAALAGRFQQLDQAVARAAASTAMADYASGLRSALPGARSTLGGLSAGGANDVLEATLLDARGRPVLRAVGGDPTKTNPTLVVDPLVGAALDLPAGQVATDTVRSAPDGSALVALATPVFAASNPALPVGIVRVDLSLSRILAVAASRMDGAGTSLLVNAAGETLASASRAAPGPAGSPPAVGATPAGVARPPGTSATTDSSATIAVTAAVPDRSGWQIRVVAPARFSPPAAGLLLVLGAIVLLLIALIVLMARQVIRPAEELEASRTRLRELYEMARVDSLRDALTGLGNHRAFQEEFDRRLDSARTSGASLSLILLDLDDFKTVNDEGGHAAGDEALARFARTIRGMLSPVDRAFRVGGDEFALLLAGADADRAEVTARRLLASSLDVPTGRLTGRPLSFSAGVSSCPALGTERRHLLAQADAALAWAKRHGRTTIDVFDPERHSQLGATSSVADLSRAISSVVAGKLLRPVFQPIVDLRSGRVIGYEGLIRPLPASGFGDPSSLFAAAEVAGRTFELDGACLEAVAGAAAMLTPDAMLTINLSPRTLESDLFSASLLVATVRRAGLDPSRVVIEITEREQIEEMERLRRNVAACRAAGFRLAADDVGAGNAGLRLLSQVQFDIVKIDLSLVQSGAIHEASLSVVGALQDLARRWGATVIAEGIETPEQLQIVRELDIGAGQGYLLGRPGSAEDLMTIEMTAVDLEALLGRDDWLHRMARGAPGLAAPAVLG